MKKYTKAIHVNPNTSNESKNFIKRRCIIPNQYYIFSSPLILDNFTLCSINYKYPKWEEIFEFVSEDEFFRNTGINNKEVNTIIELLETREKSNQIIAVEMYKQLKNNNRPIFDLSDMD